MVKVQFYRVFLTFNVWNYYCTVSFVSFWSKNKSSCLDVAKEEKLRLSQRPDHSGLDFSSQLDESTDFSEKDTMPTESDPAHQYTWLPSSNTCLLKSWSWLVTLPVTTRKQELFHDIFNSLSATTKNWTNFCLVLPSPPVVSCQTSKLSCSPRRTRNKPRNRSSHPFLHQKAIFIATHLKNSLGSCLFLLTIIIFARHFFLGKVLTYHRGLYVEVFLPPFPVPWRNLGKFANLKNKYRSLRTGTHTLTAMKVWWFLSRPHCRRNCILSNFVLLRYLDIARLSQNILDSRHSTPKT